MLLTTTEQVMGREYDILGLVKGATIQSKNIGRDFGAGLKKPEILPCREWKKKPNVWEQTVL